MQTLVNVIKLLGDDWMNVTLNLLKILGVIVSGFAGIVAASPDKPRKKEKKRPKNRFHELVQRTFSKESALRWAVVGLAVALLSQFGETIKSSEDNKDAEAKFRQQISAATNLLVTTTNTLALLRQDTEAISESLDHIKQITTRFDTEIKATATLALPNDNPKIRDLKSALSSLIGDTNFASTTRVGTNAPFYTFNVERCRKRFAENPNLLSARDLLIPPGATLTFHSSNTFFSAESSDERTATLAYFGETWNSNVEPSLTIGWDFRFSKTNWTTTTKRPSIQGLLKTTCGLTVSIVNHSKAIEDVVAPIGTITNFPSASLMLQFDDYPAIVVGPLLSSGTNTTLECPFTNEFGF